MRIYISGAISGVLDFKEKFDQAEKHLKQTYPNAEIINPTMIVLPSSCTHEDYMKIDFMLLDLCDSVYFMPGWEWSKGCNQEYGYAMAKDLIILEED
jgi:hypothetical protein